AGYGLQQNEWAPIEAGDGALVGLLAGLIGAVVQVVISLPVNLMFSGMEREMVQRILDMTGGNMPPEVRGVVERYGRGGAPFAFMVIGRIVALMFWLCVGAVFSAVGGFLGAAIFKKSAPA